MRAEVVDGEEEEGRGGVDGEEEEKERGAVKVVDGEEEEEAGEVVGDGEEEVVVDGEEEVEVVVDGEEVQQQVEEDGQEVAILLAKEPREASREVRESSFCPVFPTESQF